MKVSLVITSKNRKEELNKCIHSCLSLNGIEEILVFDDGSTDNTFEFVQSNFPTIQLHRTTKSIGLINARTKCASLACGDIIVSIDDDCTFQCENTIAEIIPFFSHKDIAAVTIPVVDVLKSTTITQKGIGEITDIYISSQFRGCAHAIRKDIFLAMGGYYENLVRQEEETEISMRLYNNGYIIRIGNCTKPILHRHSSLRNEKTIAYYRARNQFLINYKNSPSIFIAFAISHSFVFLLFHKINRQNLKSIFSGIQAACIQILKGEIKRSPMSITKYIYYKKIRRKGFKLVEKNDYKTKS